MQSKYQDAVESRGRKGKLCNLQTNEVKKKKIKLGKGDAISSYQNKPPSLQLVLGASQRRPWAAAAQI
jgi:hypothetical protein